MLSAQFIIAPAGRPRLILNLFPAAPPRPTYDSPSAFNIPRLAAILDKNYDQKLMEINGIEIPSKSSNNRDSYIPFYSCDIVHFVNTTNGIYTFFIPKYS